jgi:two-component system LytT family response regulator
MISCILIEDEPLAAEKLKGFIKKIDFLDLRSTFDNGADAISYLNNHLIELIFLDICMEEFDGMQLMAALSHPPKIIITSAESQYALPSYEYKVTDYLLKPFGFDRFVKAMNKVAQELKEQATQELQEPTFIFVKTEYRIERIDLYTIQYIVGMKDYLSIVLIDRTVMTLMSFSAILLLLPSAKFSRVHKSYIVALDKIKHIERNRIRIEEELIPISESYKLQFLELLKDQKHII